MCGSHDSVMTKYGIQHTASTLVSKFLPPIIINLIISHIKKCIVFDLRIEYMNKEICTHLRTFAIARPIKIHIVHNS